MRIKKYPGNYLKISNESLLFAGERDSLFPCKGSRDVGNISKISVSSMF